MGWVTPARRLKRVRSGDAPGLDGAEVGVACRQADGRVAVLAPGAEPVDELPAPGLAGGGLLEEYGQQVLGHRGVLDGDLQDDAGKDVHVPPAPGAGAGEDNPAGLVRADQGDFLGDEPAEREAEQVISPEPESVGERDGVQRHRLHGARRGSGGAGHASVVQEDDFSLLGDRVDQERIPVVEVGPEVHEEHERQRGGLGVPEAPVGIGDPVRGLDPQVRRGDLASVTGHLVDLGSHDSSFHSALGRRSAVAPWRLVSR